MRTQGSYGSLKTWKVKEFDNLDARPGKSWSCNGHGKRNVDKKYYFNEIFYVKTNFPAMLNESTSCIM